MATVKEQYSKLRKRTRDYLSRQRRSGLTIKAKLPKIPKRITSGSITKLEEFLASAKEEAAEARVKRQLQAQAEEQARKDKEYAQSLSARELAQKVVDNEATLVYDRETGELIRIQPTNKTDSSFDTYRHVIETSVFDWTRNGTQTEFTERIELFVERCIGYYGSEVVAKALMEMAENGMSLSRLERYNNDYCHDWIAELQSALSNVKTEKKGISTTIPFPEDIRKEFEELFLEANEDNFNGALDAEVYQQRYSGKFESVYKKPWKYRK